MTDTNSLGTRVLRRGMTGKDVDQLIMLLVKGKLLSATQIPQSSLFNEDVERAVKQFQTTKGLPSDGVVDYRTLLLLRIQ
jgi:murein L,D-transpeptidase YcbB/YkuD